MGNLEERWAETLQALEQPNLPLNRRLELRKALFSLLRADGTLLTTAAAHLILWLDASEAWPPRQLEAWPVSGRPVCA